MSDYEITVPGTPDGGPRHPDLKPREARDRWIDKLRVDKADTTVSDYHYRLEHFVTWCEEKGIDRVSQLSGWELESYETHRRQQDITPLTLAKELGTLRGLLEYCARIEQVDDALPDKITIPDVDRDDHVDETRLHDDEAHRLINHYRTTPERRYTRGHAMLEAAWYTGARMGALRGLDLNDLLPQDQAFSFRHRPQRGTTLKNGRDGERIVSLPDDAWETIQAYIEHHRYDSYDDDGSSPLFTSTRGRASSNAFRAWMYQATEPCLYRDCPHGKERISCEWTEYAHASKCPSSRSPHQVRTGSITWQLNRDVPKDVVAERVNTSVRVLERHYDVESRLREMQQRRAQYVDHLDFTEDQDNA